MALYVSKDELVKRLTTGYIPCDGKYVNVYKAKGIELDDLGNRRLMACVMLIVNSMDDRGVNLYPKKARGDRIRGLRIEKRMSVAELSRKTGLNMSHLHRIEGGKCDPFQQTLAKIADALGVKVEDLE